MSALEIFLLDDTSLILIQINLNIYQLNVCDAKILMILYAFAKYRYINEKYTILWVYFLFFLIF